MKQRQQQQHHHDSKIPLWKSRLLNEDGILPGIDDIDDGIGIDDVDNSSFFSFLRQKQTTRKRRRKRILLEAEETHEIHMFESEEYPGHLVVQRFLLVQ